MAISLKVSYPGKTTVDANNPNGTFKNRTSDALKDGTPYEKKWASDVWGFLSHILAKAGLIPNGSEENETNSQYYDGLESLVGRRGVEFETSKDLTFDYINSTQAQAKFSRMSLLDSNYIPKYLNNQNITWDITTDLEAGTSEKPSTDYGAWLDSVGEKRLVPDLVGFADSASAGELRDSTATFLTDLVHLGDIVYNTDDKTKTTASADAAAEGIVVLVDNIFPLGSENYKIVKMSPEGLGENRERLATAFNNSGSDFDDSWYTQIQEPKEYKGDESGTLDFTISLSGATGLVVDYARLRPYHDINGDWRIKGNLDLSHNADAAFTISISGITFKTGVIQPVLVRFSHYAFVSNGSPSANINGGNGDIETSTGSSSTSQTSLFIDVALDSKPPFHH